MLRTCLTILANSSRDQQGPRTARRVSHSHGSDRALWWGDTGEAMAVTTLLGASLWPVSGQGIMTNSGMEWTCCRNHLSGLSWHKCILGQIGWLGWDQLEGYITWLRVGNSSAACCHEIAVSPSVSYELTEQCQTHLMMMHDIELAIHDLTCTSGRFIMALKHNCVMLGEKTDITY